MKGIILAGGSGTRLYPLTLVQSKQLLPVYDKPMVYYPLSVLLSAGIRDVLIITTPNDAATFRRLLGDGGYFGINISYETQSQPRGIAEAFLIGREFIGRDRVALILGDNIFYGHGLPELLKEAGTRAEGATIFGYNVSDPQRYGVIELSDDGKGLSIEEKPLYPRSNIAITGLYFYDNEVVGVAQNLRPSNRGELEISDINRDYLNRGALHVAMMGRGFAWLDTGTPESLLQAAQFVEILERRQGVKLCSPEETAYRMGLIDQTTLLAAADRYGRSNYGHYLRTIAAESPNRMS